jgi:hypothetical protein
MVKVKFENFSSRTAHPLSSPVAVCSLLLGVKWPGHEADLSLPPHIKAKNCGAIQPPSCVRGEVVNKLSTVIALAF